jgi:hypothetical protein
MMSALLLFLTLAAATAMWLAGTVGVAAAMRVPVKSVTWGFGPRVADLPIGASHSLEIRAIPLTSNIAFRGRDEVGGLGRAFADLDPWRKITLALSGCATCFAVALTALGYDEGMHAILATYGEVLRPVTMFHNAMAQWQPMLDAARGNGFATLAALAAAKVGAFNLLPLAGLSGWVVASLVFGWRADDLPPAADAYFKLSLIVLLALGVLWAFSAVEFFAQSQGWIA